MLCTSKTKIELVNIEPLILKEYRDLVKLLSLRVIDISDQVIL